MSSIVQICNLALTRIGADTITSLTDGTREANLCNTLYDDIAEEVMSEGEWTSCTFRATLNQTTNTPVYDYSYEYQLPTNPRLLKIITIQNEIDENLDYSIEEDKLLTDDSVVKIKYIGFVEDSASYGPYLKKAIVSRMAYELAYTLTGSVSVSDRLYRKYEDDLRTALANDGQQGPSPVINSDDLTRIR